MTIKQREVLFATPPFQWAPVPDWCSFWWLIEVETCPRRVALRSANYPDVWNKTGYPPKPQVAAIVGQIVHATVGTIVTTLRSRGAASVREPDAISILRELGGFSKIISRVVTEVLDRIADNPRLHSTDRLQSEILRRLPHIREKVQALLSRAVWPSDTIGQMETPSDLRQALAVGPHFEILLKSSILKWRGVADLIDIRPSQVSIVDFKTGEPSPHHAEQIRTYSLLWARDCDANPLGARATDLVLSYPTGNVAISAPNEAELRTLESDLLARTASAKTAMRAAQPPAQIALEHCSQCDVKHLCTDYWIPGSRKVLALESRAEFDDVELLVEERLSEQSWRCKCLLATHVPINSSVLLRIGHDNATLAAGLETNSTFRVVGALVSHVEQASLIISIVGNSELFRVPQRPAAFDQILK
jgi:PD-(D/E)XK nuclease superfamily